MVQKTCWYCEINHINGEVIVGRIDRLQVRYTGFDEHFDEVIEKLAVEYGLHKISSNFNLPSNTRDLMFFRDTVETVKKAAGEIRCQDK